MDLEVDFLTGVLIVGFLVMAGTGLALLWL